MLFNSFKFIYVFLPVTYLIFWALRTKRQRYVWLTIAGYIFYGFWNYRFCALMAFSTLVSYFAGLALSATDDPRKRKLFMVVPISVDLALLGFFKYAMFFMEATRSGLSLLGFHVKFPSLNVVLPIGISFYTFHTISYIVDAYRRKIVPTRDLFEFSCYVSLFSQLVAGPIVRFREVEADLESIDRTDRKEYWGIGWSFFAIGLTKKVLLADTLAAVIDPALAHAATLGTAATWMCMFGYAYQLYFDFSGYSDMAVGLGYLFGIRIPQNFASPYKAVSPSDFWTRWHISLSSCMRDYVYIPLGGNRQGSARTYRNLMLTMLIGGLWHGAGWTFILWGAYHGLLLILHRLTPSWDQLPIPLRRALMFVLVTIGWVFFRAKDLSMAGSMLRKMFSPSWAPWPPGITGLAGLLLVAAAIAHLGRNTWEMDHRRWRPAPAMALGVAVAGCLIVIYGADPAPFLYFQF